MSDTQSNSDIAPALCGFFQIRKIEAPFEFRLPPGESTSASRISLDRHPDWPDSLLGLSGNSFAR